MGPRRRMVEAIGTGLLVALLIALLMSGLARPLQLVAAGAAGVAAFFVFMTFTKGK